MALAVPVRQPGPIGRGARDGERLERLDPDPLEEMHVAVNRSMPSDYPHQVAKREAFLPDERLDLPTAIAGFTMGSAYVNHLDDETGSIEVGKAADLVVLDRDLFEHPASELSEARVLQTFVGGSAVYEATAA